MGSDRKEYLKAYRAAHQADLKRYDARRSEEKAERDKGRVHATFVSRPRNPGPYKKYPRAPRGPREIIGVDGEGRTEGGKHKYLYMAAYGLERRVRDLDLTPLYEPGHHAPERTKACLEFLLALPQNALVLGFSLGYDYTKILEGLDDKTLFSLARPETRQSRGNGGPRAVHWGDWEEDGLAGNYRLNYIKGKFTVAKIVKGRHKFGCKRPTCPGCMRLRSCTVWDIFAFFQASFIKACKEWKVVTEAEYDELKAMKDKRGAFTAADWPKVVDYCGQECRKMAALADKLLRAHEDAGIQLHSYYGAGSTAARMLKVKFDAKRFIGKTPAVMTEAVACGFFGGRFEISRVGPVRKKVYSYDIASAYPYQFTFLPCLKCGTWEKVSGKGLQRAIETGAAALVRYALPVCDSLKMDRARHSSPAVWGPFPFRAAGLNRDESGGDGPVSGLAAYPSDGSIIYPVSSGGGWVYRDEFLMAQRHFPNVVAVEAWIYRTDCGHIPFNDPSGERGTMPEQYILRLEWGKDGKGIVVKLGVNSCYGKAAQSVGNAPPFQCFVWAGIVTSGCRAQLLEAMMCAKSPHAILGTATDGILSLEKLRMPEPRDTGTAEAARLASVREKKLKLPLGAWEEKILTRGIMQIRPGIAFPLDPKVETSGETKARGVGKDILFRHREAVMRQWEKHPGRRYDLKRPMFFGMKASTDPPSAKNKFPSRRSNYGTWDDQEQSVSYDPFPKRPRMKVAEGESLRTWALGPEHASAPYDRLLDAETRMALVKRGQRIPGISREGQQEKAYEALLLDQPDRDEDDSTYER